MTSPLALLGGEPVVTAAGPHFSWPPIDDATRARVTTQLESAVSIPSRSGIVADLEDGLQEYFGVRHAITTSSGTAALHAMYAAARVDAGDEVIVPAWTFHATASPLFHLRAVPVLCETSPDGNIDPACAEELITPRTRALMATHLWGRPADTHALAAVAGAHGVSLLEDGSHAHGASVHGRKIGTFGLASAFSLNGPKPLSGGEGGFVLTDDDDTYYRVLTFAHYNKRCRSEIPKSHPLARYAVTGSGLKLRIHPLAAALAFDQLHRLDGYLAGRAEIARFLADHLAGVPGLEVMPVPEGVIASWYGLTLTYHPERLGGLSIERFHQALAAEGAVEFDRPGSTRPLHELPLYQHPGSLFPGHPRHHRQYRAGSFPVAEHAHRHTIKLPVWHREQDLALAEQYVRAAAKVSDHHQELL
ncbi:aminotransferase class I/II-fold pyridoxal phosphate-dependent enzyme [Streptomyces sp. LP05-1]|uniref:Aminotransferase class I/II-fold pyridoxal phosphate-dependent enzyme n=1 Tax=Streptomyces pyxinae TaxID=2970734 RepID=A0ABT2CCL1_9ACTN|nr:aminotransferase class I/II-fold pyridoxal phosphate-dependent enzyme [Streptomyces sp. LP05-1]MCS0635055.1 aminotransferase class I/II-fold pyridoxal phosphate-dependent enzyme [Streptomyces sp. LP05-1]